MVKYIFSLEISNSSEKIISLSLYIGAFSIVLIEIFFSLKVLLFPTFSFLFFISKLGVELSLYHLNLNFFLFDIPIRLSLTHEFSTVS